MGVRYKILIDTSVWIDFFRNGKDEKLSQLMENNMVCTNEIILTELLPNFVKNDHQEAVEGFKAIDNIPLNIDWGIIRKYRLLNLSNGINRVGIPDLIILQQVIDLKLSLYTFDKHFELMQNHLSFDLLRQ